MAEWTPPVFACAFALLLAGCAQPIATTIGSVDGKRAEFDHFVYLSGLACASENSPHRAAIGSSGCPPNGLRRLREFFAERSRSGSLKAYLSRNGTTCRSIAASSFTCDYDKTIRSTPRVWGQQVNPAIEDRFELTLTFSADDHDLTPEQIHVALRRFSRTIQ
jgi:hypothetical protein